MSRMLLEVIVQSVADAREAARGGADRLEVVRAIGQGGLTPGASLVEAISKETGLPLRVMLREHDGFDLRDGELSVLQRAAAAVAALGVDGVVLGFAQHGGLNVPDMRRVLTTAPGVRVTLHRAFEAVADWRAAIHELTALAMADRILTSGGEGSMEGRLARLREYQAYAGDRVTILAGGGVTEGMIALLARTGGVAEVHVGRAARENDDPEGPVSAARVRYLRELAG